MIYGIGIDIVKVQRMKDADKKWGRNFFEKILTENEIAYCYEKSDPYPSLAVRFAAKEAVVKAIGADIYVDMKDIDIMSDKNGRPSIRVHGKLEEFFKKKGIKYCHLSLSHEKEFGVASVVLEG